MASMMRTVSRATLVLLCSALVPGAVVAGDLRSDTWVATDGVGRTLPGYAECGPPRPGKYVGVFYFLWLGQHGTGGPYDITRLLEENPADPQWGPLHSFHHWGEPELGYYLSDDSYVLRRHAHMFADAGVDVVIFDVTNGYPYQTVYTQLCNVFSQIRTEGGTTPRIAFLAPFWDPDPMVRQLYDNLYGPGLFADLWFTWKGKPLILADIDLVTDPAHKDFFTFRKPVPSYFPGPDGPDQWGWLEIYPQHGFYDETGAIEEVTVSVAQNAVDHALTAMSDPRGAMGRSWHGGHKEPGANAVNHGYNFAEQWQRALELDPAFVFVTGWNEWVAQRLDSFGPVSGDAVFVDAYTQEYSRDAEPMKGGHTDNYYYQMVANIRGFKGVRAPQAAGPARTITIDGTFEDWTAVDPEFRDTAFDTVHRNHDGWGSAGPYVDTTGRNDIVRIMVAYDDEFVYFYAKTQEDLTASSDPNWMLLFIDADSNHETGWEGYDYLVNQEVVDANTTTLKRSQGGWNWSPVEQVPYRATGNRLELRLPRTAVGMAQVPDVTFDFHWADNLQQPGEIADFALSGDSAPNRRFNYHFYTAPATEEPDGGDDGGVYDGTDGDEGPEEARDEAQDGGDEADDGVDGTGENDMDGEDHQEDDDTVRGGCGCGGLHRPGSSRDVPHARRYFWGCLPSLLFALALLIQRRRHREVDRVG